MSLFSSLERSAGAQFVSQSSRSRIRCRANSPAPIFQPSPSNTSLRSFQRRCRSLAMGTISDVFITSLLMASFCKEHTPYTRRFSSASKHTAATRLAPMQENPPEAETTETPFDSDCSKEISQADLPVRNGKHVGREPLSAGKHTIGKGSSAGERLTFRSLTGQCPPMDFKVDHEAYEEAKRFNHGDARTLFKFYIDALGEEEGTKCLQVVLSNPDREICMPRRRIKNRTRDAFEVHGVRAIVSLLNDEHSSNQIIFRAYKELPKPGVSYLSPHSRGLLLHRFAKPRQRRRVDVLRYLGLVDDMNEASLEMSPSLWTAAIHLAGKSYTTVKKTDLKSALGVWRRMEHQGFVDSTSVTFNILFDIAIKAGQFKVADKVIVEMESRGLDFSRFGRVAKIFLKGLQGDADGVRQAYHDFIEAGEIVDTVVLNCVMASLIRAGEYDAAELMYDRMKDVHQSQLQGGYDGPYPSASDNYVAYRKASAKLGRVLGMTAFLRDKLPQHHQALQSSLPLTPDAKTFHIFLSYHANQSGDLDRFMAMLEDMEDIFAIPPQGMVYIFLFQGFAVHGDKPHSEWTLERLRNVWRSFLRALYNSRAEVDAKTRTKRRKAKLSWDNPLTKSSSHTLDMTTDSHDELDSPFMTKLVDSQRRAMLDQDDMSSAHDDHDEPDGDWRYENTVYLGRKLIVSCLRAFSVCGGPDAVLDVWPQIDRLWKVQSLKEADMMAVRTVLRQLVPMNKIL
ncbi:hypothetical protein AJ80_00736 [Polytolypa hystricis UAMH7299]|uniref:Pentatricopeptide repeat protein n=1 Tax=Polytolypa hystricis (strain UAMH7299) TaxID=1447883 RepID=A0A2B7Z1M4_POLH7|nr:hypothetical protein AJ80_00736 [Polytolypa hystricis UAMH7299]